MILSIAEFYFCIKDIERTKQCCEKLFPKVTSIHEGETPKIRKHSRKGSILYCKCLLIELEHETNREDFRNKCQMLDEKLADFEILFRDHEKELQEIQSLRNVVASELKINSDSV